MLRVKGKKLVTLRTGWLCRSFNRRKWKMKNEVFKIKHKENIDKYIINI